MIDNRRNLSDDERMELMGKAELALNEGNPSNAEQIYRTLANRGYAEGLVALASLYEEGIEVGEDQAEALRLYEAAHNSHDKWGSYSSAAYLQRQAKHERARLVYEELARTG